MSDTFGPEPQPLVAPAAGFVAGDRALTYLLAFFSAVANASAVNAWHAAGIAPNVPVVKATFAHDPTRGGFNTRDLPALFLYRTGSDKDDERYADDYLLTHDNLVLMWVLPWQSMDNQRKRTPLFVAVKNLLLARLEQMRDPSWIVAGDTDPRAATLGSSIATWAGFWSLIMGKWQATTLKLDIDGDRQHNEQLYDALKIEFALTEQFTPDITLLDAITGLQEVYQTTDAPPLVIETGRNT